MYLLFSGDVAGVVSESNIGSYILESRGKIIANLNEKQFLQHLSAKIWLSTCHPLFFTTFLFYVTRRAPNKQIMSGTRKQRAPHI